MTDREEVSRLLSEAKDVITGELLMPDEEVDKGIIVGDTHGSLEVSEEIFQNYLDSSDKIVFLGDYVDRGDNGLENIMLILEKLLQNPKKVTMLRGNHESPIVNLHYGFKLEVENKLGSGAYEMFVDFFKDLPLATTVNDYLCVHGGIAKGLGTVSDITGLPKRDENPNDPVSFQLLWNDPRDMIEGFLPSIRGEGAYYFGTDVLDQFLERNQLKGLIRGHEPVDGFRFDMEGKSITISSTRYNGLTAGILVLYKDKIEKVYV